MAKTTRVVESSQKMRRTLKQRGRPETEIRRTTASSCFWSYLQVFITWLLVICADILIGFRFELLYPFWLVLRAAYESFHKNTNTIVTLANQNSAFTHPWGPYAQFFFLSLVFYSAKNENGPALQDAAVTDYLNTVVLRYLSYPNGSWYLKYKLASWKVSVFFVCVTATTDLICYLFIPVPLMIFLASTYVWVSYIWTSHCNYSKNVPQVEHVFYFPLIIFGAAVLGFEYTRKRCFFGTPNSVMSVGGLNRMCEHIQGLDPSMSKNLNAFFGAHCIGYPVIIFSYTLRYYFKEWRISRRQVHVSIKNEEYSKLLTEALPAVYEGPRDYSVRNYPIEEECEDMSELGFGSAPMLLPPPPVLTNGAGQTNGKPKSNGKSANGSKHRQNGRGKASTASTQSTPLQKLCSHQERREDDEDSEESYDWREGMSVRTSGRVAVIRYLWEGFLWLSSFLVGATEAEYDDDQESQASEEPKKNITRNGDVSTKPRSTSVLVTSQRKGRGRDKVKDKIITHHATEKAINGSFGKETRESSRDTSTSQTSHAHHQHNDELDRLKTDVMHLRAAEQDARLQLSACRNNENMAKQETNQLRNTIQHIEEKCAHLDKLRNSDRSTYEKKFSELEKKYAELQIRKNDIERELNSERKNRKDDGGKRSDNVEQYRERERQLEHDIDCLRADVNSREERCQQLERDITELRKCKETNETDANELNAEIRSLKTRIVALEESLQSENKLKVDLFRALGEARSFNTDCENKLRTQHINGDLSVNVASYVPSISEKTSPTPSQPSPPPYQMAVHAPMTPKMNAASMMGSATEQKTPSSDSRASPLENALLYNAFQTSPTGEHVLFDHPSAMPMTCAPTPHDVLLAGRMGKYGAPANPARIN